MPQAPRSAITSCSSSLLRFPWPDHPLSHIFIHIHIYIGCFILSAYAIALVAYWGLMDVVTAEEEIQGAVPRSSDRVSNSMHRAPHHWMPVGKRTRRMLCA